MKPKKIDGKLVFQRLLMFYSKEKIKGFLNSL